MHISNRPRFALVGAARNINKDQFSLAPMLQVQVASNSTAQFIFSEDARYKRRS